MLLIDGVKYQEWTPEKEIEEFQPLIKEHYKEVFGEKSIIVEGSLLRSEAGIGVIPDWLIIIPDKPPQWHIVEAELSSHSLYDHIVNQVGRFINGIKNTGTQKKIIEVIYHEINSSKVRRSELEESIGTSEVYKFISDLISTSPTLTVIIEERTKELQEALDLLKYFPIKVVEFRTFVRDGAGLLIHAHQFEPLFKPATTHPPEGTKTETEVNTIEIEVKKSHIDYSYFPIKKRYRDLFPSVDSQLELVTDRGSLQIKFTNDPSWGRAITLKDWFIAHPSLKIGDKVVVSVIVPNKKYELTIK